MQDKNNIYTQEFKKSFSVSLDIECLDPAVKSRGRKMFKDGCVQNVKLIESASFYNLSGSVLSSNRNAAYKCMIRLDFHGWIDNMFVCECPFNRSYEGLCKHNYALGLAFLDILNNGGNYKSADEQTSHLLLEYLNSYKENNHMVTKNLPDGCISIYPNLDIGARDTYYSIQNTLNAKIGYNDGTKLYVIKNFGEFLYNFENSNNHSYGKNLEFVHDYNVLDKTSKKLCLMLNDIMSHNDGGMYSHVNFYRRTFPFPGVMINRILDLYSKADNPLLTINSKKIKFRDVNPPITIQISKNADNSAKINIPRLFEIYMSDEEAWLLRNYVVYRCSKDFVKNVAHFLKGVKAIDYDERGAKKQISLILNKNDYSIFCGTILPQLKKYFKVEFDNVDFSEYTPKKPIFSFYIDTYKNKYLTVKSEVAYGHNKYNLYETNNMYRNIKDENNVKACIQQYFDIDPAKEWQISSNDDAIYDFLSLGLKELKSFGEVFIDEKINKFRVRNFSNVKINLSLNGPLIDVDITSEEMPLDQMNEILSRYQLKKKYIRLKNGEFLSLKNGDLEVLSEMYNVLSPNSTKHSNKFSVGQYRAQYLNELIDNNNSIEVNTNDSFDALITKIKNYKESGYKVNKSLKANLRDYQRQGFKWLCSLTECGLNGILADDMGLGKSLQIITVLNYFFAKKKANENIKAAENFNKFKKALIVCPASLVYNWQEEFEKFSPNITVSLVVGTAPERRRLLNKRADVYIISYDLLKRDIDLYKDKDFWFCIIDEAQYIKNAGTKAAKAVKTINANSKFALTGTPIENRLSDLWSIFDFLMPGYLYSHEKFTKQIEIPIIKGDTVISKRLQKMVTPFILRRKKEDVLTELPEKIEQLQYVHLAPEQQDLYDAQEQQIRLQLSKTSKEEFNKNKLHYLTMLTRLRQICCTPNLYLKNYRGASAKMDYCIQNLLEASDAGHKTLVFSQFRSMLEILAEQANKQNLKFLFLSGSNTKEQRRDMIKDFQNGLYDVFFISLKAGGTGLNLTAADRVIHFDPWWNFAAEDQATDRTHRIGQKNSVLVKKLVAKNTIEERIIKMQEGKRFLNDSIITGEGIASSKLNKEELLELLEAKI